MAEATSRGNGYESIQFRVHPRIFSALGADLVTNDTVAVIELAKNAYDAFATNVRIRFGTDPIAGDYLEVEDDGQGMTRDIIENVWCLIASPFKEDNPYVKSGKKKRRVVGERGLGRFAAARLGKRLRMLTQAPDDDCWELKVDWSAIAAGDSMSSSTAKCRKYPHKTPFERSGTRLRIYGLKGPWDDNRVSDLEENLARLISPFSALGDFHIFLSRPGASETEKVRIDFPEFLASPKYAVSGKVDDQGNISCTSCYNPLREGTPRTREINHTWEQVFGRIQDPARAPFHPDRANCGSFSFEIRAWDIDSDDTKEIAEAFDLQKTQVRKAIRAHKGISIYRDNVLVLPKTDSGRDWLGLDLRRVSKVGTRLSTSQIVGHVAISAKNNPGIQDTSDRERLVSTLEVTEFEELLKTIVALLENQRDEDRVKTDRKKPLDDLFASLSADEVVEEVAALAQDGAAASEALPIVRALNASLEAARKTIQERFVFYSRMATVGTIAQMLIHEIRNRTTAFGSFLEFMKRRYGPFNNKDVENQYRWAVSAVTSLERLADTFAPLASRGFRRRRRHSVLEERIRECMSLRSGDTTKKSIKCHVPESATHVAVDPGELDAILLNLIDNAVYWLGQVPKDDRLLEFRLSPILEGSRVRIWIHDSGPGIHEEDVEKVFWPGVTRKPDGIGMGLTVASELVAEYGGRMTLKHPGTRGGGSFAFDLPVKN